MCSKPCFNREPIRVAISKSPVFASPGTNSGNINGPTRFIELNVELVKTKKQNREMEGRIRHLKEQLQSIVACAQSKDDEILCLRQARNQEKLEVKKQ